MKLHCKEKFKKDLLAAIGQVFEKHIEENSFSNIILPDSTPEMLTNSVMNSLEIILEYHQDLVDGGYIETE